MTIDFDTAPFAHNDALWVDQKRTALNAANLFAIHVFHFDHIKRLASDFIAVRDQFKGKAVFGLEVFVRFERITRNAENDGIGFEKCCMHVTELHPLRGTAWGSILGVEIQDEELAQIVFAIELQAGGRW